MSDRAPPQSPAGPRTYVPYTGIRSHTGTLPSSPRAAASEAAAGGGGGARGAALGGELLAACSECRAADALRLLAEGGADLDCRDEAGRTPLHHASRREALDAVAARLIEAGAQLDLVDDCGDSALILACFSRRAATALLLVARGANVELVGEHGKTALDHANETRKAIPEVAEAIRARGAGLAATGGALGNTVDRSGDAYFAEATSTK